MNTLKLAAVAAATLVVSLSALAEGATYEYPRHSDSSLTRAEVLADLDAAQAMGMLTSGEQSFAAPRTGRALSRSEMRAELATALANDELSRGETVFVAESHTRRHGTAVSQAASSSVAN